MSNSKDIILDILLSQPHAKYNLDKTEIYLRCPFCGDSRSNRNETNFAVRIPDELNCKWPYICYRASCGAKGIITPDFLRMIGQDNFDANVYLNTVNRSILNSKKFKSKNKRNIVNFPVQEDRLSLAKLKYLNTRLGTNLNLRDLFKLKIHTDLKKLLFYNEVDIPLSKLKHYTDLANYGIAFISAYNDYLIVRNVTDSKKIKRYTNVDIFGNDVDGDKYKFYVVPTTIDIVSPEPTVINIAEGTFDVLSIYLNFDIDSKYDNHIYASISGSAYESTITHLIRQYGLVDIILNVFSDDNIKLDTYRNLCKRVSKYTNSLNMTVYYNSIGKDFGVPRSKIKLQRNIIKDDHHC